MYLKVMRSLSFLAFAAALVWVAGCGGGTQSIVPEGLRSASETTGTPSAGSSGSVWDMQPATRDVVETSRILSAAPTLVSPINDAEVVKSQGATFTWSGVSGAKAYRVLISNSSSFAQQIKFDLLGTGTQLSIPNIPPKQAESRYYWKVAGSDDLKHLGPFSSVGSFLLVSTSCGTSTTGTVSGNVVDAKTNSPIVGATVQLDSSSFVSSTDSRGNYTISNVPVGGHTGVIKKSGYLSAAIETNVTPHTCVTLSTVKLQQIGSGGGPPPPPVF